jgi:hypothetical protein
MDPRDLQRLLIAESKELMMIIASDYRASELGEEFDRLEAALQSLGITYLLVQDDMTGFRDNLVRSAQARRYFLRRCADENVSDYRFLALSRSESLLAALAAGNLALARELPKVSITEWRDKWEYEDDYCYSRFLGMLLDDIENDERAKQKMLDRFEAALEGGESPRLDVCRTLHANDKKGFQDTLHVLMEAKQDEFDARRESIVTSEFPDSLAWLTGFVSIEGLALIQLAQYLGVAVQDEFALCPSSGRLAAFTGIAEDIFEAVEQERRTRAYQRPTAT